MTPATTRWLRRGLLGLGVAVTVAVVANVRQPVPPAAPAASVAAPVAGATPATRMGDLVYRYLKGGTESFVLRAKRTSGTEQEGLRLSDVDVEFNYTAYGEPAKGSIRADECLYQPTRQLASFQGSVRLQTADGLVIESEALEYDAEAGRATSEALVAFRRGDVSGRSRGASYRADPGHIELLAEVFVRIDDEQQGATEITSNTGWANRNAGELVFEGDVELVRGGDLLRAQELVLGGTEDQVHSMRASGSVLLNTRGDPRLAAGGQGQGPRELRCEQLDVKLREDRSLEQAIASGEAELRASSAPGEPAETRVLRGAVLNFWWDEAGNLSSLLGQKGASLTLEPAGAGAGVRSVAARNIRVQLVPETGAIRDAEFRGGVVFSQAGQTASGERAGFDGASSRLTLYDDPTLVDRDRGSRLSAVQIEIETRTGAVAGSHNVQHTLERAGLGPLLGGEGGILVASRFFSYDPTRRAARYSETALLRSGDSEVRADEIRLTESKSGARTLEASGGVQAKLAGPQAAEVGKPPQASEAQSESLVYDEAAGRIVYRGAVRLRQGEVEILGPEATVSLDASRAGVEQLTAGAPVEVVQGARRVTGERMTYKPAEGSVAVVGSSVELVEGSQRVQGRSLIFFTGDDRILVDGREEARTETVLRRNPQKP